jgi:hypothetical protein
MILLLSFFACKNSDLGEDPVSEDFYGVEHQITTEAVYDQCFDGAINILFMPEGNDAPQAFEFPVYIPELDELPLDYEISLRAPFVGMEITATDGGDGKIEVGEGHMEDVLLGGSFGECLATMDVVALISPAGENFVFSTIITISALRGDNQGCPVPQAEPCTVELYMTSVPIE